jgi:hypothetical protein
MVFIDFLLFKKMLRTGTIEKIDRTSISQISRVGSGALLLPYIQVAFHLSLREHGIRSVLYFPRYVGGSQSPLQYIYCRTNTNEVNANNCQRITKNYQNYQTKLSELSITVQTWQTACKLPEMPRTAMDSHPMGGGTGFAGEGRGDSRPNLSKIL